MCIGKNFKYTPHPLLKHFPELYEIKCVRISGYQAIEGGDRLCIDCYKFTTPKDYKHIIGHGVIDGDMSPADCKICDKEIAIKKRSVLQCDDCFIAYVEFMNAFKTFYSNKIALLVLESATLDVLYLSVCDNETGTEIELRTPA